MRRQVSGMSGSSVHVQTSATDRAEVLALFEELVSTEGAVDMEKLRKLSNGGIVGDIRGVVWKFLLGVSTPDTSEEMSQDKTLTEYYELWLQRETNHEASRKTRSEISKYIATHPNVPFLVEKHTHERIHHVLQAYLNQCNSEFRPAFVPLLIPFVFSFKAEADSFFCFQSLLACIEQSRYARDRIHRTIANFIVLFRCLLPEL
eukprot:c4763_g1_i2.p1 GENE.c4763_g1_i2~~c4763_g1_i2.p1  ORF type:complete len:216 (-),score=47.12 c4763_g1_i2:33-644(-)